MSKQPDKSLLGKIGRLPADEYELMRMRHEHGMTATAIATAMNAHHQSIAKRLQRIEKRVRSPLFDFVEVNYGRLPNGLKLFARYRYLYGLPLRGVAEKLDLNLAKIRELDAGFRLAIQILCAVDQVGKGFVLRPMPTPRMKIERRYEKP